MVRLAVRRSNLCRILVLLGLGVAAMFGATSPALAGELRVGTAAVTITPPNGTPMAGYYGVRLSEGVLDDLRAKAVVLDDGQTQAVLIVCDLIAVPRAIVMSARQLVEEETKIPAANVLIAATHTHTGPVVLDGRPIEDLVTGGSKSSQDYTTQLPKLIAQAAEEAFSHRQPARVSFGRETEDNLSFIRRFWMKDGTTGWNPGKRNPNIIRPIGQVDPDVNVVYAETADKKPLWTFVNFALHLDTTGGKLISADFPGTLANRLADYKGPDMLTTFANGACGNINHIDVTSAARQHGPDEAKRIGTVLAGSVLKAYLHLNDADDLTLRVRREVVELPLRPFTEEELREARAVAEKRGANTPFLEQVKAYRILDVVQRQGKPYEVDVQVISLGRDIAWVALPGEVFVELGQSIKAASPFRQTSVIELANGVSNYIPNHSAFSEGQYEAVSSRMAEGAGELLVTTAIRLLADLDQEAAGTKPAAPKRP